MDAVLIGAVAVFGAIIGSFANAVLWRTHAGESVARGRSHCVACGHVLGAWDLVPVFSFLALRGRCRYCKKRISPSYPLIEVAMAVLFVLFACDAFSGSAALDARAFAALLLQWYVAAMLVMIFAYDQRHMMIPRAFTTWTSVIAALGGLALGMQPLHMAIGAAVGYGVFWIQYVLSRGRWIGGGDLHLGLLMGLVLGWPLIAVALFLAYVCGAMVAVVLLARRKAGMQSEIPFGTFLSAAALVTMLWGDAILGWYLGARLPL